jgi:hypothetical protein
MYSRLYTFYLSLFAMHQRPARYWQGPSSGDRIALTGGQQRGRKRLGMHGATKNKAGSESTALYRNMERDVR